MRKTFEEAASGSKLALKDLTAMMIDVPDGTIEGIIAHDCTPVHKTFGPLETRFYQVNALPINETIEVVFTDQAHAVRKRLSLVKPRAND